MAKRRMISPNITDTDCFIEMPITARLLYYDYCIRADDDGFVDSPMKILKMIGCSVDDFKILVAKQFIIPFENSICVIRHWLIHNTIRKDRYTETIYQKEKKSLKLNDGVYDFATEQDSGCQIGNQMETQVKLSKVNISNKEKNIKKRKFGEYGNVLLTDKELQSLHSDYGNDLTDQLITYLDEYIEMKGYKAKSHYLCIKKWVIKAVNQSKGNRANTSDQLPDWFDKKIESEPVTEEEKKQLDEILRNIE